MSQKRISIYEEIKMGDYELVSENVTQEHLRKYNISFQAGLRLENYILVTENLFGRKSCPVLMERT